MDKIMEFKDYLKSMEDLASAIALLEWDARVNMPKKGIEGRSDALAYLSGEYFKKETSDQMKEFIQYFEDVEGLNEVMQAAVKNCRKKYDLSKKIPENRYVEFVKASALSTAAWEEAKESSDFSIFQPHLQKIVDFKKEFVEYWGYQDDKYNTFLDIYEPGITVGKLDEVFGELKNELVDMLKKIANSPVKIDSTCFKQYFPKIEQEEFSLFILQKMGFDFEAGRLDESVHPFTTNFNNRDVRITSHYYEHEFRSALFSAIHEGGHAIYEQDIPDSLRGTLLGTGASMGIHEAQSRFYENIIGRSMAFWKYFYPEVKNRFKQFADVSFDEFYKGINEVLPSLIRTEADELSYGIHIIIRYEIEKDLINGRIKVEDLPEIWNEKYKEYLGVEPSNDAEGVLQDVHWSDGSFGYFPSYALGNLYSAQFLNKIVKDVPNIFEEMETGNLSIVHTWLKDNIHCYGAVYQPQELIQKVTGEKLKAKYFVDYLKDKYGKVYNF